MNRAEKYYHDHGKTGPKGRPSPEEVAELCRAENPRLVLSATGALGWWQERLARDRITHNGILVTHEVAEWRIEDLTEEVERRNREGI